MSSGDTAPDRVDDLRRLAFTILSPSMARSRRARLADTLARTAVEVTRDRPAARQHLVSAALHVGPTRLGLPRRRGTGVDSPAQAVERSLAAMAPAARAAFALLHLENLSTGQAEELLTAAGVPDPQTAVSLAERTPLDPAAIRALTVPAPAGAARTRIVAAGAIVVVVGLAAPVLAATAGGGESEDAPQAPATVPNIGPEQAAEPAPAPAKAPDEKPATEQAEQPAPQQAEQQATQQADVERDITRILRRLDDELARPDLAADELARLRTLRAAVLAEQARVQP